MNWIVGNKISYFYSCVIVGFNWIFMANVMQFASAIFPSTQMETCSQSWWRFGTIYSKNWQSSLQLKLFFFTKRPMSQVHGCCSSSTLIPALCVLIHRRSFYDVNFKMCSLIFRLYLLLEWSFFELGWFWTPPVNLKMCKYWKNF